MRFPVGSTIINVDKPLQLCEILSWHTEDYIYYVNILTDTDGNPYEDTSLDIPIDIGDENWVICTELTKALV